MKNKEKRSHRSTLHMERREPAERRFEASMDVLAKVTNYVTHFMEKFPENQHQVVIKLDLELDTRPKKSKKVK